MNIVKVSILIFLLSVLFVGLVYDYGNTQSALRYEYNINLKNIEEESAEYKLENERCVELSKQIWGGPTSIMTIGVPQKYLINGYNVRGLWYLDSYGCIVSIIPTPTFSGWKHDNGKSYWKDLAKRLSVLEVSADDTNTTESNQLEHSKIIRVETNASGWDCWFYPEEDRTWCVYTCYCGCGDSNCEGDPEYNEGCTPEEPKLTGLTGKWEMVDEYSTELNVSIGEVNISDWSEVDESIFEMYPIHNPPTIYVMQVSSGWDYRTFKLPIYRRI